MPQTFDPNSAASPGSGIFGLPHTLEESRVVLFPVPVDITTSYGGGASRGPRAILKASKQVDLFDVAAGRPYEAGIFMLPESRELQRLNREGRKLAAPIIARGGDVEGSARLKKSRQRVNEIGARVNQIVYETAHQWLDQKKIVGVVGGDHSAPFGLIQAYAEKFTGLGVLHFDAHADLRKAYEGFTWSHASIMRNVVESIPNVSKLVQVGIRDLCEEEMDCMRTSQGRIVTFFDDELKRGLFAGQTWASLTEMIVNELPPEVYISFDIDGLDPALCPHTGTPVPGGLSFEEAVYVIGAVARVGRRIVGFDLNEVAPAPNGRDEWDANVGARLLYKMIGYTLLSQQQQ